MKKSSTFLCRSIARLGQVRLTSVWAAVEPLGSKLGRDVTSALLLLFQTEKKNNAPMRPIIEVSSLGTVD